MSQELRMLIFVVPLRLRRKGKSEPKGLGASWGPLGASWAILKDFCAVFEASWAAKPPQDGSKTAQGRPKTTSRWPQDNLKTAPSRPHGGVWRGSLGESWGVLGGSRTTGLSKTAQGGPRCGHARQILVSLQHSHYFLSRDTQRESTGSQRVANK